MPSLRSGSVRGSDEWFVSTMVPGTDPFEALEAALLRVAVNPPPSLLDQLRGGDRGVLRSIRRCLASDDEVFLLVIDQFEELFTGVSPIEADAFLTGLATAVQEPTSPLRLVVTLRADYYHRPLTHPTFSQLVNAASVSLTPLAPDELERAIVEPARRVGAAFQPGLVARIAAETVGQIAPLPLLQYALGELFDRRSQDQLTVAAYEAIGGMSGALAARAEALYQGSSESVRAATRRVFGQLIDPGAAAADLRRRVLVGDLGSDETTATVLEQFGAARLITFDRDVASREPTVEVAHEALLREWPRLVEWLDEDRELLRSALSIATAATSWNEGGRNDADLYRGVRLESAAALAEEAPERLRPVDIEFVELSRQDAAAASQAEANRIRRLRRLVGAIGATLVVAVIAGGLAIREQRRATDERNRALAAVEDAELATIVSRSAALGGEDPTASLLLALEAHRRSPGVETQRAVVNALSSSETANKVASFPALTSGDCSVGLLTLDGLWEFTTVDDVPTSRNLQTGEVTEHRPADEPCVQWMSDAALDRRVDLALSGQTMWFGPYEGPWATKKEFDEPRYLVNPSFLPSHVLVFASFTDTAVTFHLLDDRTGEHVGEPIAGGEQFLGAVEASNDGSIIALASATPQGADGDGHVTVVDGATGKRLVQLNTPLPATRLAIDEATNELFMWMVDGQILTVDLETGTVVGEVSTSLASSALDLRVRPDGLLVGTSAGQIEVIDRRIGPVGETIDLRNAVAARYRPDGLFTVVNSLDQMEVFDIESSALVDTVWDMPTSGAVAFIEGRAVAPLPPTSAITIDLETGVLNELELTDESGDLFVASVLYPEPDDGLVGYGDGVVARWVGDQMVERVDLERTAATGARHEDRWAIVLESRTDNSNDAVAVVDLTSGALSIAYTISLPETIAAHPTADGGVHVVDSSGILRTYAAGGNLVSETDTGMTSVVAITMDAITGRLAIGGFPADLDRPSVVIVDPATGAVNLLTNDEAASLGFASEGALLVITAVDGTVRLWDMEHNQSAGAAWDGSNATSGLPPWFDVNSKTMWTNTSGKVVEIPVNPERWIERACEIAGRDFTDEEWDRLVPGDQPLQSACG